MTVYFTRPPRLIRLALAAVLMAATGIVAVPADAHDRSAERQLRRAETALLGPAHAAEHARGRRLRRSPRWRRAMRAVRARARTAVAEPLDSVGRWSTQFDIPVFAINAIVLPTGKVLWFAYPNNPDQPGGPRDEANAWLWDPSRGTGSAAFERVDPPIDPRTNKPVNIWCSGNSLLADGRVLVTGGNLRYPTPTNRYAGLEYVYTFDPFTETWTKQPDMRHGRWYPSQLLMPDGRTLIMGGLDESSNGTKNPDMELFTPAEAMNGRGTMTYLGAQHEVGDYYPHLFWMPSGRALVAGPYTNDSWWLVPPFEPPPRTSDIRNFSRSRVWGTAVLVPGGPDGSHEVAQLGGSDLPAGEGEAVASAELFDERTNDWTVQAPGQPFALNHERSHHNTVLLPDGSMVTIGGGWGTRTRGENNAPAQWAAAPDHLTTELWDPATRRWRLGPPQREYRAYHSTAVLLPDGRVVSAGDDYNGRHGDSRDFTQDSAEIYEPPYLFDGDTPAPRPAVTSAPGLMTWAGTYEVHVSRAPGTARNVTRAVLVAPSATTHAVDMNQRYVPLEATRTSAGTLSVRAPADRNVALPGWYMLFVVDENGTPSVAAWVRLGTPPASTPSPAQPGTIVLPAARARIVRRDGRRLVRLKVNAAAAPGARVRVRLLDRRRVRRSLVVMVRTGRTTLLRGLAVPRRVRSVTAAVRAVGALPAASGRITSAGIRVRVAGGAGRRASVRLRLTGGGHGLARRRAVVLTGRSVLVPRLSVPKRARAVEVTLEAGLGAPR